MTVWTPDQGPPPLTLAAKALLLARADPPPLSALTLALAYSVGAEGAWATLTGGAWPFQGTNNFGAIHATSGFAKKHASDLGFGMVAFLDHSPAAYITRMSAYPSLLEGARAYLDLVASFVNLDTAKTERDFSVGLYLHGYFQGFAPNVTPLAQRAAAYATDSLTDDDWKNIDAGANLMRPYMARSAAAMAGTVSEDGDPAKPTFGPFAPLAVRLTPADAYGPHTIDHARELLGAAADHPPPGAVSLGDALAHNDGVWVFGLKEQEQPAKPPGTPWGEIALVVALPLLLAGGTVWAMRSPALGKLVAA